MSSQTPVSPLSQKIKITAWNANGLLLRKTELAQFLSEEKIDVALISETHLTSRSHAEIRNYSLYTCNHPSGSSHGGAAIYVRKSLRHHEAEKHCTPEIQAASINAELHCGTNIRVAAIYSPPRQNRREELQKIFQHHRK